MREMSLTVTGDEAGDRIDRFLAGRLGISNREGKRLVEQGEVAIDGERAWRASQSVEAGSVVTVNAPGPERDIEPTRVELGESVIYRDEWVLEVAKPPGLPTHATHDPDRDHAQAAVERLLGAGSYVGVHHRLDVETSGVLVFAIDRRANRGLAHAFSQRKALKTYVAICRRAPDDVVGRRWEIDDYLAEDRSGAVARSRSVRRGGKRARTSFEILAASERMSVVVAKPATGRTHQIRVHLSERGRAIAGDRHYGGALNVAGYPVPRAMLHAWRLELPHPITDEPLRLEAPPPADFSELARALGCSFEACSSSDRPRESGHVIAVRVERGGDVAHEEPT